MVDNKTDYIWNRLFYKLSVIIMRVVVAAAVAVADAAAVAADAAVADASLIHNF